MHALFDEPGYDADLPVHAPGRLPQLLRQDDPDDGGAEEAAAEVRAKSVNRGSKSEPICFF